MYGGDATPVVVGSVVLTLAAAGLAVLTLWWLMSGSGARTAYVPPSPGRPGLTYRCLCHERPIDVHLLPTGSRILYPGARHARPKRLGRLRHRIRP
ncbi:hypothetical protein CTZ27_17360 [Streptomyces griseocarneus]|nr:hypothetical protein CTZ27_17360 [Streptomyces griseocarneus]